MNNHDRFLEKIYNYITKDDKDKKPFLEKNLGFENDVRRLIISKYVIKEENIPENLFRYYEDWCLKRGLGVINLVDTVKGDGTFNSAFKYSIVTRVIREQTESINVWLDYLLKGEGSKLPLWAKVWAFQGVLKAGTYNKEREEFSRRRSDATVPFIELDKDALADSIQVIQARYGKKMSTSMLDKLDRADSFRILYGKLYLANRERLLEETEGIWKEYAVLANAYGKDTRIKLTDDLKGHNTGFPIDGYNHLFVYYTKDNNGEYKIPRIAIFKRQDVYGKTYRYNEVYGIDADFKVENNLQKVLDRQLEAISPNFKWYYRKLESDMRLLDDLYQNYQKSVLTDEETEFLYELYQPITYADNVMVRTDPRVSKIRRYRNKRADLAVYFNCEPAEIGLTEEDLYRHQLVYFDYCAINNVRYEEMKRRGYNLPTKYLRHSVRLTGYKSLPGLVLPEYVANQVDLPSLRDASGIVFPTDYCRLIRLPALRTLEGLVIDGEVGTLVLEAIPLPDNYDEFINQIADGIDCHVVRYRCFNYKVTENIRDEAFGKVHRLIR